MKEALFDELLESVREGGAVLRGERQAARSFRYEGPLLIEIREHGERVWHISEALERLPDEPTAREVRDALRLSQKGFADLLGISVTTLQGWEQGRRAPRGPARRLLQVAARHPEVLAALDSGAEAA